LGKIRTFQPGDVSLERQVYETIRTPAKSVVMISCPDCGKFGVLNDHQVDDSGKVSPSVVCPHNCGFHEMIRLAGWKPGEKI